MVAGILLLGAVGTLSPGTSPPARSLSSVLDEAAAAARGGHRALLVESADAVELRVDGIVVGTATRRPETDVEAMLRDRDAATRVEIEQRGDARRIEALVSLLIMVAFLALVAWALLSGRFTSVGPLSRWRDSGAGRGVPPDRFSDVAGIELAKAELLEVVEFLKEPRRWEHLGARVPRGVLLSGPPGTGKTLLARATAGEAGVAFLASSGSGFVEIVVGVGAARVRTLFKEARKHAPAVIYIDELDAIGRQRGSHAQIGHDQEQERSLNQLLVEMDGFERSESIVVIASTNRPDLLDSALTRTGRFDRQIRLDLPEQASRAAILRVHARGKPLADDVDLDAIARDTWQFSGADLANLLNEAAIEAGRRQAGRIAGEHVETAYERVLIGPRREGRSSPEEKRRIAVHEIGHAIVAQGLAPLVDPLHRLSIVSRGSAAGYTRLRPGSEDRLLPRSKLMAKLAFTLGGYVAERLCYDRDSSLGPGDDIERANELAWDMVCRYGMDEEIGPFVVDRDNWLDETARDISDRLRSLVDERVRETLAVAQRAAEEELAPYAPRLGALADALVEEEVWSGERLDAMLHGADQ